MTIKNLYPTQRPALDLNFANSKRLDPRVSLTRASVGTYVGNDGLIKTAAAGAARFDHDPETGESLGLLVEESRTNLVTYSNMDSGWSLSQATFTPNTVLSPDGTFNAGTLTGNSTVASHYIGYNVSMGASPFTFTCFIKAGSISTASLFLTQSGNNGAAYNLSTGVVSNVQGTGNTASIQNAGNGWWRCSISNNGSADLFDSVRIGIDDTAYTAKSATGSIYIWGAQVEAGSFPTSYIPTSGSTVTRAADVVDLTNTNVYDTDSFTILNEPYGAAAGGSTLNIVGGGQTPVKRTTVYNQELSQSQINTLVKKDDEFWRWRILGSSFALPEFLTDGQVTVDWGDGTIETLTTSEHTFTDGGGYHDVGFRLDSGTYFRPHINGNASHDTKVVTTGPAPESMKLNAQRAFSGCSSLKVVDATIDTTITTNFIFAWQGCSSLTSFPLIDTSNGTSLYGTWLNCSSLTSFPLIDTSIATSFIQAWQGCSSLTSFPLIDTSSGTDFNLAWYSCNSLTSFPLIDTSSGTNFTSTWYNCSSLTSFPAIDTSSGTNFTQTWRNCSSLTSFPSIDASSGSSFNQTWRNCSSLTSFPLVTVNAATTFFAAWADCSSLTDFPANFFDSWTGTPSGNCFVNAWDNCSSLTATSVENILNSIDTSGQSAPASGVDITIDYDAGTGTPSISTAVTNLKSRGWTITLNGVAQ